MNKKRKAKIHSVLKDLEQTTRQLEFVLDAEQDARESLEEHFPEDDRIDGMEENIDNLESAIELVEEAIDKLETIN